MCFCRVLCRVKAKKANKNMKQRNLSGFITSLHLLTMISTYISYKESKEGNENHREIKKVNYQYQCGITSGPYEKEILKKFNYTILFMKYYIYTSKMQNQAIHLSVFVNKVLFKYRIESFRY